MNETTESPTSFPYIKRSPLGQLSFGDLHINELAVFFPEPLREPISWLLRYVRTDCRSTIPLLQEKMKSVGFHHDASTWVKIAKGLCFVDKSGAALEYPVMKADHLAAAISALRTAVKREKSKGIIPFIETQVSRDIWAHIDNIRDPGSVTPWTVIIGDTGSSKTASFREYVARNSTTTTWIESSESFCLLLSDIAASMGISVRSSNERKCLEIEAAMSPSRCLIFDNAQDLYNPKNENQKTWSFLRKLSERTGVRIVLCLTTEGRNRLTRQAISGWFEQFEGRTGGSDSWLRLPEYPLPEDCVTIASAFGLTDAPKYQSELAKIARRPGRIRILFNVLQRAQITAAATGKPLSIDLVREVANP